MVQQFGIRFFARTFSVFLLLTFSFQQTFGQQKTIWKIGEADNSPSGMALAPDQFKRFLEKDFGYEDNFFLIGHSDIQNDWPYVLPGPVNGWGGTGNTSGIRSHFLTALFDIKNKPATGKWKLTVDILETDSLSAPFFKVLINGKSWNSSLRKDLALKIPVNSPPIPKSSSLKLIFLRT